MSPLPSPCSGLFWGRTSIYSQSACPALASASASASHLRHNSKFTQVTCAVCPPTNERTTRHKTLYFTSLKSFILSLLFLLSFCSNNARATFNPSTSIDWVKHSRDFLSLSWLSHWQFAHQSGHGWRAAAAAGELLNLCVLQQLKKSIRKISFKFLRTIDSTLLFNLTMLPKKSSLRFR